MSLLRTQKGRNLPSLDENSSDPFFTRPQIMARVQLVWCPFRKNIVQGKE